MKERIEFITESSIKGRKEIAKINEYVNNLNFDCEFKRKIEQVPETWEELKELCRNSKIPKCYFKQDLFIKTKEPLTYYEHICVDGVLFVDNGCIYAGYENDNVSTGRTPAQMWQVIKNLIGE